MQRGTNHRKEVKESISEKMKRKHALQRAALEFGLALTKALQKPDDAAANYAANLAFERFDALRAETPLSDAVAKSLSGRDETNLLPAFLAARERVRKAKGDPAPTKLNLTGVPSTPRRRLNNDDLPRTEST